MNFPRRKSRKARQWYRLGLGATRLEQWEVFYGPHNGPAMPFLRTPRVLSSGYRIPSSYGIEGKVGCIAIFSTVGASSWSIGLNFHIYDRIVVPFTMVQFLFSKLLILIKNGQQRVAAGYFGLRGACRRSFTLTPPKIPTLYPRPLEDRRVYLTVTIAIIYSTRKIYLAIRFPAPQNTYLFFFFCIFKCIESRVLIRRGVAAAKRMQPGYLVPTFTEESPAWVSRSVVCQSSGSDHTHTWGSYVCRPKIGVHFRIVRWSFFFGSIWLC